MQNGSATATHYARGVLFFLSFFPFFCATKDVFRILISKLLSFAGERKKRGGEGNFERTYVTYVRRRRYKLSFSFLFYLLFAMDQPLSPFHLHSLAFFLFFSLSLSLGRRVSKGSTRWSCDLTISVPFFIRSTFIFPFFSSFFYPLPFLSFFLFFNQPKGAQSISSLRYVAAERKRQRERGSIQIVDDNRHVSVIGILHACNEIDASFVFVQLNRLVEKMGIKGAER